MEHDVTGLTGDSHCSFLSHNSLLLSTATTADRFYRIDRAQVTAFCQSVDQLLKHRFKQYQANAY